MKRFLLSVVYLLFLSLSVAQIPAQHGIISSSARHLDLYFEIGGQSNVGTINTATGRIPYASMQSYLQTPNYTNVYVYDAIIGGGNTGFELYVPNSSNEMGWLDQYLYVMSKIYRNVYFVKTSSGGTTLEPTSGVAYPRNDFKARANQARAALDVILGTGNYDRLILWDQGETDGSNSTWAANYQTNLTSWFTEIRSEVCDCHIVYRKKNPYQSTDFQYIETIRTAQENTEAGNAKNHLVRLSKSELQDQSDDFSHDGPGGAVSAGNDMVATSLTILNRIKQDETRPTISSVVVENAAPSNIVFTFSENINPGVLPFWKDFSISPARNVKSIAISGATVTLTVSEPFYTGQSISVTYVKRQFYENTLQDFQGNEVDAFASQAATNNVSTAVPTYSNRYTSNFSAGVDGWFGFSGGGVAAVDGIGGEDDVLRLFADTDNTPLWIHNSVFTGTIGHTYRHRFNLFVPSDILISGGQSNDYSITITNSTGGVLQSNLYPYTRRNVLGGTWFFFETVYTLSTTGTSVRYESAVMDIGEEFYLKNVVIDRIQ